MISFGTNQKYDGSTWRIKLGDSMVWRTRAMAPNGAKIQAIGETDREAMFRAATLLRANGAR